MLRATFVLARLHAEPAELTSRILLRGDGGGWAQPGDPLLGRPVAQLLDVARRAISDDTELERRKLGDLRVDTTGLSADQVADAVLERSGWPGPISG